MQIFGNLGLFDRKKEDKVLIRRKRRPFFVLNISIFSLAVALMFDEMIFVLQLKKCQVSSKKLLILHYSAEELRSKRYKLRQSQPEINSPFTQNRVPVSSFHSVSEILKLEVRDIYK